MKQFYEAYADEGEKLSTVLREIKDKDDEVVEYGGNNANLRYV